MRRTIIMTISLAALFAAATNAYAQENKGKFPKTVNKVKESIDPAAIAGLQSYDAERVFKTLKVRRTSKKAEIASVLDNYNDAVGNLRNDNLELVAGLGIAIKDIINEREFKHLWNARSDYKKDLETLRAKQAVMHGGMEDDLMEVLTRRQERKWEKYQGQLTRQRAGTFDMGDLFSFVGF